MRPSQPFIITRRQLGALISRLNRSYAGRASTGAFLENLSKLLQVFAIVGGGTWVLIEYFDFKKTNNELTNVQLELTNQTAKLNQASIALNNRLNELKIEGTIRGRLEATSDSSIVRSAILENGISMYRLSVTLRAKNISDRTVIVPIVVIEFFLGSYPASAPKVGKGFLVNEPFSWRDTPSAGEIQWESLGGYVSRLSDDKFNEDLKNEILKFKTIRGGFVGTIRSGETNDWTSQFVLKAGSENLVAAVATFWAWPADSNEWSVNANDPDFYTKTRFELLSEAEDAPSLKPPGAIATNPARPGDERTNPVTPASKSN